MNKKLKGRGYVLEKTILYKWDCGIGIRKGMNGNGMTSGGQIYSYI